MTFEEYTRHIDWSLTVGRRRTRQAASTVREAVYATDGTPGGVPVLEIAAPSARSL